MLGSVGTAPAAAAVFDLAGSFTDSNLNSPYDNGYFSGTYSIDDSTSYVPNDTDPNRNPGGLVATLSQLLLFPNLVTLQGCVCWVFSVWAV